jgi:hypothetical protein
MKLVDTRVKRQKYEWKEAVVAEMKMALKKGGDERMNGVFNSLPLCPHSAVSPRLNACARAGESRRRFRSQR